MKLDAELEKRLESEVMPLLEKGRQGFDVLHTYEAVAFMEQLIETEGGSERILKTAMYLHDTGYSGLMPKEYGVQDLKAVKEQHMANSERNARSILTGLGFLPQEIEKVAYLVRYHDDDEELDENWTQELQLVFEADSLAQLSVPPNFKGNDYPKAFASYEQSRASRFRTKKGNQLLGPLLENARQRMIKNQVSKRGCRGYLL